MTTTPAPSSPVSTGIVLAIAGAIAFSGKGVIIKLAYRYGVDAATFIMLRMLFALPFFLLMGWWAERRASARAQPLNPRDVLSIVGLGFLGGPNVYMRNTPKRVASIGALSEAERPSASARRVAAGSRMPSSHSRAVA